MEQSKKKTLIISIIGVFIVIVALLGVTYAFFNYTRTGPANTVGTGRIYFDHTQGNTINMENAFPISSTAAQTDTTNAKTVQIIVTGDTDYSGGEEYLITATDVNMETTTGKAVPISLEVSVTGRNSKTLGTAETGNYYTNRDSYTTSKYKVEYDGELEEDSHLLVGWIAPNTTSGTVEGVDGIINIKAYFNEDDILITDTLENGPIEEVGYDNGTQNNGKTVLTTSEWNSLRGNNALSFKIKVEAREGIWVENPNDSYNKIIKDVNTTTQINFANTSSVSNGQGVYILPGTENNTNPIYYYRGAVDNNNVIFGDYCWQMVRTTDTGGIKMIYNGVVTGTSEEPTCENTTHESRIITSGKFNKNYQSVSDAGYMKNSRYVYSSGVTTGAIYGKNVEWDGTNYLVYEDNNTQGSTNTTKDNNHHYSCGTAGTTSCPNVRYYYYNNYYITLTSGALVEDAIYKMTGNIVNENVDVVARNQGYVLNQNNSTAKTTIENWFKTNLTNEEDNTKRNYANYLEDTIYCNDRSFKTVSGNTSNPTFLESGWNPNGGDLTKLLYFGTFNRFDNSWYSTTNVPTTACPREIDSFSASSSVAHLNYPVGLLTVDEIVTTGASGDGKTSNTSFYLYTSNTSTTHYWSLSPHHFDSTYAAEFILNRFGEAVSGAANSSTAIGLRPVVSLKPGTEFEKGGEGTPANPYVVKYE